MIQLFMQRKEMHVTIKKNCANSSLIVKKTLIDIKN